MMKSFWNFYRHFYKNKPNNFDGKYYLAEIKDEEKKNRPMNDPLVLEALNAQLSFKEKISLLSFLHISTLGIWKSS